MTNTECTAARNQMVAHILATVADPAKWMIEARTICERLGLNPASALILSNATLEVVCYGVADAARKYGKTAEQFAAVLV